MAMLVGYGTRERVAPIMSAALIALCQGEVEVLDMLRVEGGRFWSLTCTDPACCPPEGRLYDLSANPIAAQAVAAGWTALADRDELAELVAPIGGTARAAMQAATDQAEQRLRRWARECRDAAALRQRIVEEGVPYIRGILQRGGSLGDDEVAWLGVLLTHLRVRDEAWVRTDENHLGLWREVMRRVEPFYVAAPACLTAYAAYLAGNGALANVALDRAFAADPDYTMAQLLADLMLAGVPPSQARLAMTP